MIEENNGGTAMEAIVLTNVISLSIFILIVKFAPPEFLEFFRFDKEDKDV